MADNRKENKPESEILIPFSFGNIKISTWPDGGRTYQLRLDSRFTTIEPNPDWSDAVTKAWRDFQDHGVVPLYKSDGLNLMDVGQQMRPEIALIKRD